MAGRLKLRRGTVVSTDPLLVEVAGERRPAWADEVLLGPRATLGPPWAKDHRVALAATIVGG